MNVWTAALLRAETLLVVALSTVLIACATGRPGAASLRTAPGPRPAAPGGRADDGIRNQVLVRARVIDGAPAHPKIRFDLGQSHVGADRDRPPPPADANQLDDDELAAYLAAIERAPDARTLSAPTLVVNSGESAWIRIGRDDDDGEPIDGLRVDLRPTVNIDGTVTIEFTYRAFGLEVGEPAASFPDGDRISIHEKTFTIRQDRTQFALATGYIGAPMHLVAVSAEVIDAQGASMMRSGSPTSTMPAPAPAPTTAIAPGVDPKLTHVDFYAVVWDSPVEPPLHELFPDAHRRASALRDGGTGRLDLIDDDATSRRLIEWWRAHAVFRLGGKEGARLARAGTPTRYEIPRTRIAGADVRQLRLDLEGSLEPDRVTTVLTWFELDPAWRTPHRRLKSRLPLEPHQALVVTMPVADGVWRMVLIRADAADPGAFRGQTEKRG